MCSTLGLFMVVTYLRCTVFQVTTSAWMQSVCPLSLLHFIRSRQLTGTMPVNFINHQDPNYPKGSTAASLLSSVTWPKYTLDTKKMLLFSDDATEEYTTVPDTYRADAIAAFIELQLALGQ